MSDPYFPDREPTDPSSRRERLRRLPRTAMAVALVLVLAGAGTGIAFAAGSASPSTAAPGSSPSTSLPGTGKGPLGRGFGRPHGPFGFGFGFGFGGAGVGVGGAVVHGQATVRAGSGYRTVEFELGKVTSVSTTSITVESTDGYTQTYAVDKATEVNAQAGGVGSVSRSDQVTVLATIASGKETATSIFDLTKIRASRQGFGLPVPGSAGQGGAGPRGPWAQSVAPGPATAA